MSVSGGLKNQEVERGLRGSDWDRLCGSFQGKYSGRLVIAVEMTVATDGRVAKVSLPHPEGLAKELLDAVRAGFKRFRFPLVAGGGTARIRLELVLM